MAQNVKETPKGIAEKLPQLAALAVTPSGLAPSSMKWELTEDVICSKVKELLVDFIPDIKEVTVETGRHGEPPQGFAWLPSRSSHVIDTSMENSALNRSVQHYSKELKEVIDKFCPKECKRLIADANPGTHLVGIPIDLERAFRVIFDVDGIYAAKATGNSQQIKSRLNLSAVYRPGDGNEKFGKLMYIEIEKSTSIRSRKKPRPTKGFNY